MRVHVALTPELLDGEGLHSRGVAVIDVFRAATTVATALGNGCPMIIPALTADEARARARDFPRGQILLGGERGGKPIGGFDLGNSPLEYTADRVAGKTVILTTTNGTGALLKAAQAAAAAVGGLINVGAIARWARGLGRNLTLLCAGEAGDLSLEDTVCAGLIVEELSAGGRGVDLSEAAMLSRAAAREYRDRLDNLRGDSRWGRHLTRAGRQADLTACLSLDALPIVPLLTNGVVRTGLP